MELVISADGTLRCVYDERLALTELGKTSIARASHAEPTDDGHWLADLSPVGGPALGPFAKRSAALDAERAWLEAWLVDSLAVRFEC